MKRKLLGIIKCAMLIGAVAVCVMVSAKDVKADVVGSGTQANPWECGETGNNVKAYLDGSTLKIYGTGKMLVEYANDGHNKTTAPWKDANFTSVEIGDGITYVSAYAFMGCPLESVSIADSVKEVQQQCFSYCSNLKNVKLPNNSEFKKINNYMFKWCTNLTNIVIPNSVEKIYMYAFWNSGLTSITIPSSVIELEGHDIFSYCGNLTSITFEDISSLSYYAEFVAYCASIKNIVIKQAADAGQITTFIEKIYKADYCPNITTITVPEEYVSAVAEAYPGVTVKKYVPPVEKKEEEKEQKVEEKEEEKVEASEGTPTGPSKSVYDEKMDSLIKDINALVSATSNTSTDKKSADGNKTIYLKDVTALSLSVMKALKSNPNVSLDMTYTYKGIAFHVVIPAKAAVFDESIPWYGPLWLYAKYGQGTFTDANSNSLNVYIVQSGDTLRKIAAKFGMTLEDLIKKNPQIKNIDKIAIGDKIFY